MRRYLTFLEKRSTGGGGVRSSRTQLLWTGCVTPFAVVMFGNAGDVAVRHAEGTVVVDRWLSLRVPPKTAVLLRKLSGELEVRSHARAVCLCTAGAGENSLLPFWMATGCCAPLRSLPPLPFTAGAQGGGRGPFLAAGRTQRAGRRRRGGHVRQRGRARVTTSRGPSAGDVAQRTVKNGLFPRMFLVV